MVILFMKFYNNKHNLAKTYGSKFLVILLIQFELQISLMYVLMFYYMWLTFSLSPFKYSWDSTQLIFVHIFCFFAEMHEVDSVPEAQINEARESSSVNILEDYVIFY